MVKLVRYNLVKLESGPFCEMVSARFNVSDEKGTRIKEELDEYQLTNERLMGRHLNNSKFSQITTRKL